MRIAEVSEIFTSPSSGTRSRCPCGESFHVTPFASRSASETTRWLKSSRTREIVSEPITIAKTQRITNVSSAETSASRILIGSRSKRAAMRATNREGER